jgi:hypothetical protein
VKGVLEISPGHFGVVECKYGWLSAEENKLKGLDKNTSKEH